MKRLSFAVFALVLSSPVLCQVTAEIYCFRSGDGDAKAFELRTYYDPGARWQGAAVKYRGSKLPITLVLEKTESVVLDEGRPHEWTSFWLEVFGGKVTGRYQMTSQGAMIYAMSYTNLRNQNKTSFHFDSGVSATLEAGCQW